ncbi:hypothetical protein [Actinocrispum wychmicini]|uniref:Uncharacterized protein n=1 Tax=Actinocrispum wychmicini TaxID=1213861 RepID=A0A4R2JAN0_9PSEU|nr:hypothetical protein [Actinocrispum wychmicini]TCO53766.1 hypothetical protein EV192_110358 [Actinocrispum wychmicini]
MSTASNPTRPAAGSTDVQRRLRNLKGAKRRRLQDWGYPVDRLAEMAGRGDAQADAVDALLAIILDRGGYTHNDADVAAAERVAKQVSALMTPYAYLVARHKAPEKPVFNIHGYLKPGQKDLSGLGVLGIFGGVFLILVVVAVIVVLVR